MQHTRESEKRVGFGGHANADQSIVGLVEYFRFPVVDLVLLGHRQITLDAALGIEELDLGTASTKQFAISNSGSNSQACTPFS